MPGSLIGTEVVRVEDPELLVGQGTFIGNMAVPGLLHLVFVRSPHAHAVIGEVDLSEALAMPGVAAAFVNADLGVPSFHTFGVALNEACARPPLAEGKARFVGDPVVAVLAETAAQAADAAEAVVVDYETLPAVVDPEAALAPGAPVQFDELGSNLAAGLRDADGDALEGADVVVRGRFVNQRIAVVPMEGNAIAVIPGESPRLTVYVSTQMPHLFRSLACRLLDIAEDELRVIAPHVGGGFGGKAGITAEHAVALAAARRLGRPVTWVETRSENLVALPHGRAQVQYVEMGFSRDGCITGLHVRIVGDAGAYGGFGGGLSMGPTRTMAQGVYRIPKLAFDVAVAVTNTTPMGAFRGAGRPEAAAYLERIMDIAADELGIDPVDLRRRNLLPADVFPYTTLVGTTYDTGDYLLPLDRAVEAAGYTELRAEQAARRAAGDRWQLGIGVSTYVEVTAGGSSSEYGSVEVHDDGTVTVSAGTSAHGQGHATSFAMIVADRLGVPMTDIRYVQSDTALVPRGAGTGGSRSLQLGGTAVHTAAEAVLARARRLAAALLEADEGDIVLTDDGRVGVAGVPARALSWAELAQAANRGDGDSGGDDGDTGPLTAALDVTQTGPTYPFGAHVAVVEVDLETGQVRLVKHVAVDDCGRILNPLLVRGQQHGGIAQGAAQALWEQFVYDEHGNPLTSTLAEYAMPSAAEFPFFDTLNTETPTPLNPLGAKGIGESGTIGSMPAVQNAVIDAVSHLGVRHIEMPCSPERVWRAISAARGGADMGSWREPPAVFASLPQRGERRRPPPPMSRSEPRPRPTQVYLEVAPRRTFACALDWPGWCRSAKTADAALETLAEYGERYAVVADRAGVPFAAAPADLLEVVEELEGSAGTDFGVPERTATADARQLTSAKAREHAALLRASWDVFAEVVSVAPPALRKGPRGGGRDRDKIVAHVVQAEAAYARKLAVRRKPPELDDTAAIDELRAALLDVLSRSSTGEPVVEKGWRPRYAARRIAWHVLDHAWEIEDRSDPG